MSNAATVLIVEDDVPTQLLLTALASRNGMTVTVASDGDEALHYLSRRHYDVVLLDLMLPKTNGFDVLRHVSCVFPRLLDKVVIITGLSPASYAECAYLGSVRRLLRKPFDVAELELEMLSCWADALLEHDRRPPQQAASAPREAKMFA
ncbi:MAG TPA: response regulator [Thermoanaerobaculia bacterium]|jgi:CheY-like chemotaxis protein